jgi:hypothetical protein
MIVLFGLLYFGYATIGRQRQDKAASYAAWAPGAQAGPLVRLFWAWQGDLTPVAAPAASSAAAGGDTTLAINGWIRKGDEYYGAPINGTTFIPAQYHIQGFSDGGEVFNGERLAVDLWNFAIGAVDQRFNWVLGQGTVQQERTRPTDFSKYLNSASGGFVNAPPPSRQWTAVGSESNVGSPPSIASYDLTITRALNGLPDGSPWLQRSAVDTSMTYQPTHPDYLRYIYRDPNAAASTFGQYIAGNYSAPGDISLLTAKTSCDVTLRTKFMRTGAEEGAPNVLSDAGVLLNAGSPPSSSAADTATVNLSRNLPAGWTASAPW